LHEPSPAVIQGQSRLKVCQHLIGFAPAQLVACLGEPLARAFGTTIQPDFGSLPYVLSSVVKVQDALGVFLEPFTERIRSDGYEFVNPTKWG
jgi:hypothetical protein